MGDYRQKQKDENYAELLQVAEMYRDQMRGSVVENSLAYRVCDTAIKNYYKVNPCPHRLKAVKPISSACGCETTVTVCQDCETILSKEITDC